MGGETEYFCLTVFETSQSAQESSKQQPSYRDSQM